MLNNFRKYPLKQEQIKDFQALLYKLKNFCFQIQGFSRFVQTLYRGCLYMKHILARQPVADSCQKIFPLRQEKIWINLKTSQGTECSAF